MNPRTTRILKEARALFWPWCAVMIAGVFRLVAPPAVYRIPYIREGVSPIFFLLGIPLLATLSLGNEFQHRTLSLLLSQPVSRMKIWREKLMVTAAAVVSAAVVFGYGWWSVLKQEQLVVVGLYVITATAAATFWTLLARSTMGGIALNILALGVFELSFIIAAGENVKEVLASITALWIIAFAAFCYAGLMLWLGGRKLARFQVTGGMAGDDLLMAGPSVMPEALAGLFRCRPTGPFLNLIRKELRLLRPIWLMTLLVVLYFTCLITFRLMPEPKPFGRAAMSTVALIGPVVGLCLVIAALAGSLSLGEERTSGTHSWHMTLPVSARRQWFIKLVMAMFTGFVCALLLPNLVLIAGGFIFGSPFMYVDTNGMPGWLLVMLLLSFASFWCACAVNGTVRATLWVVPAVGALFLANRCGEWIGQELAQTTGTLREFVVSWFHLSPWAFTSMPFIVAAGLWLVVPTSVLAVIQSYRLFRTQPPDSILWMIRCLLPLAIVAFLCSFSVTAGFVVASWQPFSETHEALEQLQPGMTKLDAAHPLQLTVEDLAKSSPLSALTRRWLRNSNITVAPDKAHSGYFATIHLASGLDCRLEVGHYGGKPVLGWRPCVRRSP